MRLTKVEALPPKKKRKPPSEFVAARRIQNRWRKFVARRLARRMVHEQYQKFLDDSGQPYYYHVHRRQVYQTKPKLLGDLPENDLLVRVNYAAN